MTRNPTDEDLDPLRSLDIEVCAYYDSLTPDDIIRYGWFDQINRCDNRGGVDGGEVLNFFLGRLLYTVSS